MEKKTLRNLLLGAAGLAVGVGTVLFVKKKGNNAEVEAEATENNDEIESENNDEE